MVNKVQLYISQIKEDLANGLTWFQNEDLGYGSIQEKYGAKEFQIKLIQQHPKLVGLEPNMTLFEVVDNTIEGFKTQDMARITRDMPDEYFEQRAAEEVNIEL